MKYSAVVVLALSSFSLGAISDLPQCAQKAISDAVTSVTTCALSDQACQCEDDNKTAIQGAATPAVLADCGADKALEVLSAANAACAAVVVSTTPSATPAPSTTASSTASESSSAEPTTTTTIIESTTVATTTSTSTTASLTPSASANGTISASPTPKPSEVNGASQLAAGLTSLFALGLAALAAF